MNAKPDFTPSDRARGLEAPLAADIDREPPGEAAMQAERPGVRTSDLVEVLHDQLQTMRTVFAAQLDALSRVAGPQATASAPAADAVPEPAAGAGSTPLPVAAAASGDASSGEAERYWVDRFANPPDPLDLPFDRPRPERRDAAAATLTRRLDAERLARLREVGSGRGGTLFATLVGALQILLSRLSNQGDVVIAVPPSADGSGNAAALLPLRLATRDDASLAEHFAAVGSAVRDAFRHRDYSCDALVRRLGVRASPGLAPLAQVRFGLESAPADAAVAAVRPMPDFDLAFDLAEAADGLRIDVGYRTDVLDAETVSRWADSFEVLLAAVADGAAATVGALPVVPATTAAWLVETLNRTEVPAEDDATVIELIARQAALRPGKVALQHGDRTLTYGALEEAGNRLARHLRARLPEPGARVAVALDRSLDMVVALLAVMKAGHTYIPLDPSHPEGRLSAAMEAAGAACLVAEGEALARLAPAGAFVVRPDADRAAIEREEAAPLPRATHDGAASAYIIFTSGSTGVPKGVEVPHRALANFLRSMAEEPGFGPDDRIVALTTISFDIAALELYLPLVCGGTAIVADRTEVIDGFALVERVRASGATVLQATPTLWRMLVEAGLEPGPRLRMLCGGEPLPADLAERLLRGGGELWNMYGPTETTIWSSVERVEAGRPITIGHPIRNTALHILSPGGQLQPVGAVGELHIGGIGLAHGYAGQPELTARSFREVALPGRPAERLYNTGDVGRRLADGSLQLLGRRDQQVKLRGFRIELGDIEAALRRADGVQAAAVDVKARPNGDRQLVGYYVAAPGAEPASDALAAHVAAHLPGYMVPTAWMRLDALPETANGKLDRKALPAPAAAAAAARVCAPAATAAAGGLEERLAAIWRDVLGLAEIDAGRNVFALGADSLAVFRVAARLKDEGLDLDARDVLRFPTVASLARRAASLGGAPAAKTSVDLKDFRHGARRGARRQA